MIDMQYLYIIVQIIFYTSVFYFGFMCGRNKEIKITIKLLENIIDKLDEKLKK